MSATRPEILTFSNTYNPDAVQTVLLVPQATVSRHWFRNVRGINTANDFNHTYWYGESLEDGIGTSAEKFVNNFTASFKNKFPSADDKKEVKHIYFVGCEKNIYGEDGETPFLQKIANGLYDQGFHNVVIHAFQPIFPEETFNKNTFQEAEYDSMKYRYNQTTNRQELFLYNKNNKDIEPFVFVDFKPEDGKVLLDIYSVHPKQVRKKDYIPPFIEEICQRLENQAKIKISENDKWWSELLLPLIKQIKETPTLDGARKLIGQALDEGVGRMTDSNAYHLLSQQKLALNRISITYHSAPEKNIEPSRAFKWLKGAFRVTGLSVGGYAGFVGGAALGSVIPIVGTVIGGLVGALIGAGVGYLIGKGTAKSIRSRASRSTYANNEPANSESYHGPAKVSLSNPEKFYISNKKITEINEEIKNQQTSASSAYTLMKELRTIKNELSFLSNLPGTESREKKLQLEKALEKVKKGKLIYIENNKRVYYFNKAENSYKFFSTFDNLKNLSVADFQQRFKKAK